MLNFTYILLSAGMFNLICMRVKQEIKCLWLVDRPGWCSSAKGLLVVTDVSTTCLGIIFDDFHTGRRNISQNQQAPFSGLYIYKPTTNIDWPWFRPYPASTDLSCPMRDLCSQGIQTFVKRQSVREAD